MHVVGRYDLDAYLPRQLDEKGVDLLLLGYTVVLKFDIEIPFLEHVPQHDRVLLRALVVTREEKPRDPARQTRRQTDHAFRVLFEQFYIDARLVIEAVDVGEAVHLHEIAVAVVVLGDQKKVVEVRRSARLLVHVLAGVELATDDRLQILVLLLARAVHSEYAEHIAVICDRDAGHTFGASRVEKGELLALGKSRRAVQKAHIRVHVKMHERLDGRFFLFLLLLFAVLGFYFRLRVCVRSLLLGSDFCLRDGLLFFYIRSILHITSFPPVLLSSPACD